MRKLLCAMKDAAHEHVQAWRSLVAMYHDNQVDQYYDRTLLRDYARRYALYVGVIPCLALTAIVIPLIIRIL